MKRIKQMIIWLKGLYVKDLKQEVTWTVKDFERAKRWAKARPHPTQPGLSYWDYIYSDRNCSTYLLSIVNQEIQSNTNQI